MILLLLMLPASTATAATELLPQGGSAQRSPLTLELLQERLKSPLQSQGVRTIELRQLNINLRSENAEFRDHYMPILWDRRWNWLNYYDFSLNNLLKLGFNDIRLRDKHLPGIISALVWYQWSLGILYIALLLWTLSRTIPGLNLLIYLK
jgi:hypothetical protein